MSGLILSNPGAFGTGGGGEYTLPVATDSVLGGVKIGANVDVAVDGTISVTPATIAGQVNLEQIGNVDVTDLADEEILQYNLALGGWVNVPLPSASLSIATDSVLGGIKSSASVLVNGTTGIATVPLATTSVAGLLSNTDKTKLDSAPTSTQFATLLRVDTGGITAAINCATNSPQNILYKASTISGNVQIANPTNGIEGQIITWHGVTSGTGAITFANLFRRQFGVTTINYTTGQTYIFTALFTNSLWHINWSTY